MVLYRHNAALSLDGSVSMVNSPAFKNCQKVRRQMVPDQITRRDFLQESAATAAVAAASAIPAGASAAQRTRGDFASNWDQSPDRVWLGPEYWANPLQDWRVAGGRIECIKAAANRNVHLLTRQLGEQPGRLQT